MRTAWSLALTAMVLAGCAARHEAYCRYEGPARIGQTVYISGPSLRVDQLVEDSRCPIDVTCMQAGTVRVRATVIAGNGTNPVELTLGKPVQVADGRLTLLSVQPQKRTTVSIAPEDYRFTFDFQGGL